MQKEGSSSVVVIKALVAYLLLFRVRNSESSWCFSSESEIRDRADVKSDRSGNDRMGVMRVGGSEVVRIGCIR